MRSFRFLPVALALLPIQAIGAPPSPTAWTPTLQCDFSGSSLDTTIWSPHYTGTEIWNEEAQAYQPGQVSVHDGSLHLLAEKKPTTVFGTTQPYTSGMATTRGKWSQQYGYFEIRARVPSGRGLWPAFWGLPTNGDWPPEIDVLELLGDAPDRAYMTNHWGVLPLHEQKGGSYRGPDYSQDFHLFAVEWNPRQIRWYIDDTLRAQSTSGVPHAPFYWLLNLAVGGTWPGYPDSSTRFPASFEIDWARAWQYPTDSLDQFPPPPVLRFSLPSEGEIVPLGDSLPMQLALDSGSPPSQVKWYVDGKLLGTTTGGILSRSWVPRTPGSHTLAAVGITQTGIWSEFLRRIVVVADSGGNALSNGNFHSSGSGWTVWGSDGGEATLSTAPESDDSCGLVHISAPGPNTWSVQVSQPLPLQSGWTYRISLEARSPTPRSAVILIQEGKSPWKEHFAQTIQTDSVSRSFGPWEYHSPLNDPTASFKINLGADSTSIRLWRVRVEARPGTDAVPRSLPGESNRPFGRFNFLGKRLDPEATHAFTPTVDR
ncbi:MAG: family 16 glycosylhydrolase [Fibrobacteria bacterium]|nr:family 16 glycosylhydrolase [Fibrobacteria bacterium]